MIEPVVKRRRGRPRKSRDSEYDEKRKDQLRRAQRAFQVRKKEALEGQTERLKVLESAVEQMNSVFLDFSNYIANSQAYSTDPDCVNELHRSTRRMLDVAKTINVRSLTGSTEETGHVGTGAVEIEKGDSEQPLHGDSATADNLELSDNEQEDLDLWPDDSVVEIQQQRGDTTTSFGPDYISNAQTFSINSVFGNGWFEQRPAQYWNFNQAIEAKPAYHTSLGESLLQATLTEAFNALLDTLTRPNPAGTRMFRFSLLYHSKEEILFNLRWFLGPGLAHIRRLFDATILALEDHVASLHDAPQRAIGVLSPLVNTEAWTTFYYGLIDSNSGMGPFLSVRQVEEYLLERRARYLGGDLMEISFLESDALTTRELSQKSLDDAILNLDTPSQKHSKTPAHIHGMSNFTSLFEMTENATSWNLAKTVQVRFSLLLHNLTSISLCLMRGPGYHRKWINAAIMASVVNTLRG